MNTIQLPDDVYEQAAELAELDQVSVDRLVLAIVRERVRDWSNLQARAKRGTLEKLKAVMAKVGDAPPEPVDVL